LQRETATKGSLRGCRGYGKKGLCLQDEVEEVISRWNAENEN